MMLFCLRATAFQVPVSWVWRQDFLCHAAMLWPIKCSDFVDLALKGYTAGLWVPTVTVTMPRKPLDFSTLYATLTTHAVALLCCLKAHSLVVLCAAVVFCIHVLGPKISACFAQVKVP